MENRPHKNDDLWYAIAENSLKEFKTDDITDILAEVPGANDEYSWYWVLALTGGRYALLAAWCDYTGWDCRSGIFIELVFSSPEEAALAAPEEDASRAIRKNLLGQLRGEYPKFTLWGE